MTVGDAARVPGVLLLVEDDPDHAFLVRRRLDEHDWNYGFIVDGFPRNQPQARFFLESYDIDAVILLDLPDELVERRVLSRRLCSRCGLPAAPRKYLLVTMLTAFTDQKSGNSTPRCSKTVSPVFQFCWTTSRRSQVMAS